MRREIGGLMFSAALLTTSCHHASDKQASPQASAAAQQIAWREGDVDDAFAEAKEADRPVLLYWGAKWCPPCNLMKQTLFKDPAFIAETRNFVPVHLDGDAKGAQGWGEKFGIQGYPTVILLRPDHSEITRLSGGSTASTLADVLRVAATRTTSTEDLLKRADDPGSAFRPTIGNCSPSYRLVRRSQAFRRCEERGDAGRPSLADGGARCGDQAALLIAGRPGAWPCGAMAMSPS